MLSLLLELPNCRQFYYVLGIQWLYPNTLCKVQLIILYIGYVLLIVFITLEIVQIHISGLPTTNSYKPVLDFHFLIQNIWFQISTLAYMTGIFQYASLL